MLEGFEKEYIKTAGDYNLILIKSIDITKNILPTLIFAHKNYNEYIKPSFKVLNEMLNNLSPIKMRLLRLIFFKEYKNLTKLNEYYEKRLNPLLHEKYIKYLRLLFRYN